MFVLNFMKSTRYKVDSRLAGFVICHSRLFIIHL